MIIVILIQSKVVCCCSDVPLDQSSTPSSSSSVGKARKLATSFETTNQRWYVGFDAQVNRCCISCGPRPQLGQVLSVPSLLLGGVDCFRPKPRLVVGNLPLLLFQKKIITFHHGSNPHHPVRLPIRVRSFLNRTQLSSLGNKY